MTTQERIKRHEGKCNKPYLDTAVPPRITVGYGRNLSDVGLSDAECDYLFANDYKRATLMARSFHVYDALNEARRGVLIELCFWMGRAGVAQFKKMLDAMERKDWEAAAFELVDSKVGRDIPGRTKELAEILRTGVT